MMEEEQQFVGRGGSDLVELGHFRRVLAREAGAGGDAAVHADALWSARCHWPQPLRSLDSMLGP